MSIHTAPRRDLREHVTDGSPCPCMPRSVEGNVVHNSYDRREVGEVVMELIRRLGSALANHAHEWTAEERRAVEHAEAVVALHWPRAL